LICKLKGRSSNALIYISQFILQFEGKIVAPPKEAWKAGEKLISIENLDGLTIDGNGQGGIDGDGSTWWNCPGGCEHERPGV
jgi:hypothetical protein